MKMNNRPNLAFLRPTAALALAAALTCLSTHADASLIHDYQLNGNLNDALGGPALISEGGTVGASTYVFGPNQGLTLAGTGLGNLGNYSIEMRVSLDHIISSFGAPWIKLIDFQNLGSDDGLYSYDGQLDGIGSILQFYPVGGTGDAFFPGRMVHVAITRNASTGEVISYAEGFGQFTFIDGGGIAVFGQDVMRFLQDDFATGRRESGDGAIDYIRIYNSVLSPQEILGLAVPEPTSALFGLGTGAVILLRRRRAAVR